MTKLYVNWVQDNIVLTLTNAIRGFSKGNHYQVLGLETLKQKRFFRKLCVSSVYVKTKTLLSWAYNTYTTKHSNCIQNFEVKLFLKDYFSLFGNWMEKTWIAYS